MHVVTSRRSCNTNTNTERRREDARETQRPRETERPRDPRGWGLSGPRPGHRPHTSVLAPQTLTDGHTDGHRRPDKAGRTLDAHRETPLPYSASLRHETADTGLRLLALTTRVYLLELH
jgi:hypothetical protein